MFVKVSKRLNTLSLPQKVSGVNEGWGELWFLIRGIREEADTNLIGRLNWIHILRVDCTTGLLVNLEGLIGKEEVSRAIGKEGQQDWTSSLHYNISGKWIQYVNLWMCADQ